MMFLRRSSQIRRDPRCSMMSPVSIRPFLSSIDSQACQQQCIRLREELCAAAGAPIKAGCRVHAMRVLPQCVCSTPG